jgi:hypothetical protein
MDIQVGASDVDLGVIELGSGSIDLQLARSDGRPVSEPTAGFDMGDGTFTGMPESPDGLVPRELPAATYRLLAWGRDVEPVIVPVTVRIGERTPVPVTLPPATTTTITFTGADLPRNAPAHLVLLRDGAPFLALLADASQPFVRGLAPGNYRVEIAAAGGVHGAADFRVAADPGSPVVVRIAR